MRFKKLGLFVLIGILSIFVRQLVFADTPDDDGTGNIDSNASTVTVPARSKDAIGNMLLQSISLIGIPYRWGGNSPETGMDCSGFIRYLYKTSLGINLPRTSAEMARVGKRINYDSIEPGDLLFFNTRRGSNTHVGMYIGNNKMIVAPRTGQDIQISELTSYYRQHFNGAKRIVQENVDEEGNTTIQNFQGSQDEALPVAYRSTKVQKRKGKSGSVKKHSKSKNKKSINKSKAKAKAKVKVKVKVKVKAKKQKNKKKATGNNGN